MQSDLIYLDNQATTQTDPQVVEAMLPYFTEFYGNPHSDEHVFGWQSFNAVEEARLQIANLLGAEKNDIVFTSGATESVSLALLGFADVESRFTRSKIITVSTEHSCVLTACGQLAARGFEVIILPVQQDGLVDLQLMEKAIDDKTLLVSVMLANNEIGVIQPIAEIAALCRRQSVFFHTDATQALGKIPIDVNALGIDMLSASAHKLYGPKGVGVLYVRKEIVSRLHPLLFGGGQEKGLRPGTLPTPLAVGFGMACQLAQDCMQDEAKRVSAMRERLLAELKSAIPDLIILGSMEHRLAGNLCLAIPNVSGDNLVAALGDRLAVSTGSSCSSSSAEPSHVVKALGLGDEIAQSSLRISIGRFNTDEEMKLATEWLLSAGGNSLESAK